MTTLEVLYQDDALIAVNKPSGLLVHRSAIDRRETRFALQIVRDQIGQRVFPVHRLDKATSGVLLFALSPEWARNTQKMFIEGQVTKDYRAVVRGWPDKAGRIAHPLKPRLASTAGVAAPIRNAVTDYQTLSRIELPCPVGRYDSARYALVRVCPVTGRQHQIRRHFKHLFHPLIGDTTYGDGRHNRFFRDQFNCHRLLLHARRLQLPHPVSGQRLTIKAPCDENWRRIFPVFRHGISAPPATDKNRSTPEPPASTAQG